MPPPSSSEPIPQEAVVALGDAEAVRLLANLVAVAPTNLEDPLTGRYEKPHYAAAIDRIVRAARGWGLSTRVYDPSADPENAHDFHGIPRPNAIIDLDVGAPERLLVLAHYDVVPVPAEQLARWKSPPHALTWRPDGRLYGRGSNDDLGSGVVATLLAMKRLASGDPPPRNVRLLVCCDEETGGAGGVEQLKAHDARLPEGDPGRFLSGDVALIPDGSPHTTAGSCGVAFLDASFESPVPLSGVLDYGEALVALHERARTWRSQYASPDWPDHGAPEPVITGRATVTKFDLHRPANPGKGTGLLLAHAETDAANQIAESVTLVFSEPRPGTEGWLERARREVTPPFRIERTGATSLKLPAATESIQLIGQSAHGGYPHRGHNPVPAAFALLRRGLAAGWFEEGARFAATFSVDVRLTPEMSLQEGLPTFLRWVGEWIRSAHLPASIEAPPDRCRGGYALPPTHPAVARLAGLLAETLGDSGVFGEYGGTDASTLVGLTTPRGEPLPAIVFGSMDRAANIHQAEESVDPRLLAGVSRTIERYVRGA